MDFLDILKPEKAKKPPSIKSNLSDLKFVKSHFVDINLWPAGELAAQERLTNFLKLKAEAYSESRNSPIIDGTSRISPYLALGILSPKRCILEGLKLNNFEFTSGNKGICKWMDEIVWREFYRNIMHSFPKVSMNQPFQDYTKSIKWRHSSKELEAFYTGKTGFPIVDAGIRQMLTEGWMHNRLRMVVAMFFTKNMLHDWRLGEKFFMEHLIDGDFSSNNGGWQWSSSTGTDAAPYFRIFNPITQSQNFDPDGEFIKKFIPELKDVPVAQIHQSQSDLFSSTNYPAPMLDLKESRVRAIQAFKDARENTDM
jgi:deoxyribodipyrimidine photo-lyase